MLTDKQRSEVEAIIAPLAAQYETKSEHWIGGNDEGLSYCKECAIKRVAELRLKAIPADVKNAILVALMDARGRDPVSINDPWSAIARFDSDHETSVFAKVCTDFFETIDNEIFVDGGWTQEGDTLQNCETCGCALDNSLTNYGCEYELEHWESLKSIDLNPDLGHSFHEIIGCQGWNGELKVRIDRLARRILKAAKKAKIK